jgi:DNA helicase HerA-like ATPase
MATASEDEVNRSGASTEGRSFRFEVGPGEAFPPGSYVTFRHAPGRDALGQVDSHVGSPTGRVAATGRILGVIEDGRLDPLASTPFRSAEVAAAGPETIELLHRATGATLEVGYLTTAPGVPARLLPHRFNRHTFWCGQSGSGKTYALGVLIEQLLAHTDLPIVILDPNGDFVRLPDVRADATGADAELLRGRDIRVLRPGVGPVGPGSPGHLRARFTALPMPLKAAMLRLDPLIDRQEYNSLLHLEDSFASLDALVLLTVLRESPDAAHHALALRIENLGLLDWQIWAGAETAATDIIDTRPAATVLDLGGFEFAEEPLVAALSVLDHLWSRREERRPVLIVIDEAHNLCSPDLDSALQKAVREQIIRIAAEGRKFGLWLLLSTQRPSKIHASIISQCDNLALMKMSSPLDLAELGAVFGFAPAALLSQSPYFRQGEALFAGGFVPAPGVVQVRDRLTHEGGKDVSVPLRRTS